MLQKLFSGKQETIAAPRLKNSFFRALAVSIAVLVQTAIPLPAQADNAYGNTAGRHYPELFGTNEAPSNDITAFGKWLVMHDRFEAPLHSTGPASSGIAAWRSEIKSLKGLAPHVQVKKVNDFLNKVAYVDDLSHYGLNGYWAATPERFFSSGGDCKDYAIAKYVSLRALGFSADQLRVAIVQDKIKNVVHAILIIYSDEGNFVLDNQDKQVKPITAVNRYQPLFSINSTRWWLHRV